MVRRSLAKLLLISALGFGLQTADAQQPEPIRLEGPQSVVQHEFTRIVSAFQLRDGRVVVSDQGDQSVYVATFPSGTVSRLGRNGAGPAEYRIPQKIHPLGGDSAVLVDFPSHRLLAIRPDGSFGDIQQRAVSQPSQSRVPLASLQKTDNLGRSYGLAQAITLEGGEMHLSDSAAVQRWTSASTHRDTVAFVPVKLPPGARVLGGFIMSRGGNPPFTGRDDWTVAQDGRIAIVHVDPYRVDFVTEDGVRTTGPVIATPPLRVSEGHKAEWREERSRPVPTVTASRNGSSSSGLSRMPVSEPHDWPEFMPPFLNDALAFDHHGLLWVHRTAPAGEGSTYDIIDTSGQVIAKVVLPIRARIAGYGDRYFYVVVADEDGLEQLRRYAYPEFRTR